MFNNDNNNYVLNGNMFNKDNTNYVLNDNMFNNDNKPDAYDKMIIAVVYHNYIDDNSK